MSLQRDELAARCLVARISTLQPKDARRANFAAMADNAVEATDALLSRLRPVSPASGAPATVTGGPVAPVGSTTIVDARAETITGRPAAPVAFAAEPATEPRRTVGAVVRALGIEWIVVRPGNDHRVQRALDAPDASTFGNDAEEDDVFVRWATREECERHGIPYVARPLPGAPLAAPSPAATPAAWVPSVGDVVKHVSESDKVATTGQIRVVVSTNPIRWVYVENGVRGGERGPTGWGNDVRFVRRATSSERAAAGLPPVDESAVDEAKEREAARVAYWKENTVVVRDGRVVGRGWHRAYGGPHAEVEALRAAGARARVAAKDTRSGDCRPASGQSASKPVDRAPIDALIEAVRWVLNDAAFKAPEQVGEVAERWVDRLERAMDSLPPSLTKRGAS